MGVGGAGGVGVGTGVGVGVGSPGMLGVGAGVGFVPIVPGFTVPGPQVRLVLLVLVVEEFAPPPVVPGVPPVFVCTQLGPKGDEGEGLGAGAGAGTCTIVSGLVTTIRVVGAVGAVGTVGTTTGGAIGSGAIVSTGSVRTGPGVVIVHCTSGVTGAAATAGSGLYAVAGMPHASCPTTSSVLTATATMLLRVPAAGTAIGVWLLPRR